MKPHLSEFFSVWFVRFLLGFERPYPLSNSKNIHAFLLVIYYILILEILLHVKEKCSPRPMFKKLWVLIRFFFSMSLQWQGTWMMSERVCFSLSNSKSVEGRKPILTPCWYCFFDVLFIALVIIIIWMACLREFCLSAWLLS